MAIDRLLRKFRDVRMSWHSIEFQRFYREELGDASLTSLKPIINDISLKIDRTEQVKENIGNILLQRFFLAIEDIIRDINAAIKLSQIQFVTERDSIHSLISSKYDELLTIWSAIVAIINDLDRNKEIEIARIEIQRLKEEAESLRQMKDDLSADINTFEERYRKEILSKTEILKQEDSFSKDAEEYRTASRWWFCGIVVTSGVLTIMLWFLFKNFCFELSCFDKVCSFDYNEICTDCNRNILYLEIFKAVSYRILIISFISYAISICIKNYNANMHNYTVNKHKANSLSAALVLLEKAKTDAGNDQLMTQAANAIFSHQPTGFNSKNPENITTKLGEKIIDKVTL